MNTASASLAVDTTTDRHTAPPTRGLSTAVVALVTIAPVIPANIEAVHRCPATMHEPGTDLFCTRSGWCRDLLLGSMCRAGRAFVKSRYPCSGLAPVAVFHWFAG